jgi:hypothetical protein
MSIRMTVEEVQAHQARVAGFKTSQGSLTPPRSSLPGGVGSGPKEEEFDGPESKLQLLCQNYLKDRGYYFFHDRSTKQNDPGFLDLVVALPRGQTVWVELKTKGYKLSDEQKRTILRLQFLGHQVATIKSFGAFKRLIDGIVWAVDAGG